MEALEVRMVWGAWGSVATLDGAGMVEVLGGDFGWEHVGTCADLPMFCLGLMFHDAFL